MSFKQIRLCISLLLLIVIAYCFVRDIHIEAQYCGDLRNRIVGARLQLANKLPYFYKWQPSDGVTYYDPQNFDSLRVSNITATPFMHELLYPLAQLPQRNISFIWLISSYIMLVIILVLALQMCQTTVQLIATVIISSLFLFTNSWLMHVANGQIYLLLPFLLLLFFVFIQSKQLVSIFFAGLCAIALVAIRPTIVFFFLPFILILSKFKLPALVAFFLAPMLLLGAIVCNKQERLFWQDYKNGMTEQVALHQDQNPVKQLNALSPNYRYWEGYDMDAVKAATSKYPLEIQSLNNNFFVIYKSILNKKIPANTLYIISICLIIILLSFLFIKYRINNKTSLLVLSLFGCVCYMLSDFFSPIHRNQYNALVWFFPLLLVATGYKREWLFFMIALIGCLIANNYIVSSINNVYKIADYSIWLIIILLSSKELITQKKEIKVKT